MPDSSLLLMHANVVLYFMHNVQSGLLAYYHIVVQQGELDELEREEFFRLKKVQTKKKRDAADKDAAVIEVSRKLAFIGSCMCTASLHCPRPHKVPTSGLAAYALFAQDNAAVNRFNIRHAVLCTDNDCKGRHALHMISNFELRERCC